MEKSINSKNENVKKSNNVKQEIFISFLDAINWFNNHRILCNNIGEIDPSIYNNMRFSCYNEEGYCEEIYQYFITNCNYLDVEFLEKNFGLKFTFSEKLDCFILCIDHCGTYWSNVPVEVSDGKLKKLITENKYSWEYNEKSGFYQRKR